GISPVAGGLGCTFEHPRIRRVKSAFFLVSMRDCATGGEPDRQLEKLVGHSDLVPPPHLRRNGSAHMGRPGLDRVTVRDAYGTDLHPWTMLSTCSYYDQ